MYKKASQSVPQATRLSLSHKDSLSIKKYNFLYNKKNVTMADF